MVSPEQNYAENDAIRKALANPDFVAETLRGGRAFLVKNELGEVTAVEFRDPDEQIEGEK